MGVASQANIVVNDIVGVVVVKVTIHGRGPLVSGCGPLVSGCGVQQEKQIE